MDVGPQRCRRNADTPRPYHIGIKARHMAPILIEVAARAKVISPKGRGAKDHFLWKFHSFQFFEGAGFKFKGRCFLDTKGKG